ncbi:UNVERIFIED_CONTAM: hypothetical protein P3C85_11050 [Pseudomonas aeruginosa]
MARLLVALVLILTIFKASAVCNKGDCHEVVGYVQDDDILLTIFLRHDQSRNLKEIDAQLKRQGFFESFPPKGVEVVSWYVMMGVGQVVTLRLPAIKLREVNLAIENSAWGAFRTEFYPAYDYSSIAKRKKLENSLEK